MSHVASLHTLAARRPAAVMSCSLVCCVAVPSFKGVMLQLRSGMAADVMLAVAHVPIACSSEMNGAVLVWLCSLSHCHALCHVTLTRVVAERTWRQQAKLATGVYSHSQRVLKR